MKKAIFPGSFDPFTKGHEAVVNKAALLFDEIIIAIGVNSSKNYLFQLDKRIAHIRSLFPNNDNIKIETYHCLTVDFCKAQNAGFIVRGLRDSKDFVYERSIAQMNNTISEVETVFFITDPKYTAINASIVREIFKNKGPIDAFVTNHKALI